MESLLAYDCDWAMPLHDGDYLGFVVHAAQSAQQRIWASIFIVDPRLNSDPELKVRALIHALEDARARNVDVRVLVGDSRISTDIHVATRTTARFLARKGIAVRQTPLALESMHSKLVLVDRELSIVGSHNWSHEAFAHAREDSIAIHSADLARTLAADFHDRWEKYAQEVPLDEG